MLGVLGLAVAPVVLSVPAWVMGARARRDLRADPGLEGATEITVGWVLGIVGTLLTLVVLLLVALMFLVIGGALLGIEQAVQDLPTTTPGVLAPPPAGAEPLRAAVPPCALPRSAA